MIRPVTKLLGAPNLCLAAALFLPLAACGKSEPARDQTAEESAAPAPAAEETLADNGTPAAGTASAGEQEFAVCRTCHAAEKDAPEGIGPNLWGVVGRKVASYPGFAYSDAMKAKGGVWDMAALDAYLAAPQKIVPGTKMTFAGVPDAQKRKALIDWLANRKD